MSRLFSHDPAAGITRLFHYDEASGKATIETRQEVEDLVVGNKAEYNCFDERAPFNGEAVKVASIPLNIYMDLKKQGIVRDPKKFRAWLNDSDNRFFRTRPGRI